MRISIGRCLLPLLLLTSTAQVLRGQSHTPKPGTAERKEIIDALRAPVEGELKRKVIFKIDHLKVQGEWAFMRGVPREADGSPLDYSQTIYQEAKEAGAFDDWICALLRKRGREWQVVKYAIGATDVVYEGWDREHQAPSTIFQ